MNQVVPESLDGIPVTKNVKPEIVINTLVVTMNRLEFRDQNDQPVAFQVVPAENNILVLTPEAELAPGRYCLVYSLNPTKGENLYWCLLVEDN